MSRTQSIREKDEVRKKKTAINKQEGVERARDCTSLWQSEVQGRRRERVRELFSVLTGCKWLRWKTVNESDLAGNRRVAGCQVRPGSPGTCVCLQVRACLCVFIGLTPVPSSQNNKECTCRLHFQTGAPLCRSQLGHNSLNNCFRQPCRW